MRRWMLLLAFAAVAAGRIDAASEPVKQPIFLLFPTSKNMKLRDQLDSWSVYLEVDPNDPGKVLGLGLGALKKQSGLTTTFSTLQPKQADSSITSELIQRIDAKDFASGRIVVEKDNALFVSLVPQGDEFELNLSMRTGLKARFVIGADEKAKHARTVRVRFDKATRTWNSMATALRDVENDVELAKGDGVKFQGITFTVQLLGIEEIFGVGDFAPAVIYKR